MRKYRGYYIDGCIFTSEQEIDRRIEKMAVKDYITAVKVFMMNPNMEATANMERYAEHLKEECGYTPDQIEKIEINVMAK